MTWKWHCCDIENPILSRNSNWIQLLSNGTCHENDTKMTQKWHENDTVLTLKIRYFQDISIEFKRYQMEHVIKMTQTWHKTDTKMTLFWHWKSETLITLVKRFQLNSNAIKSNMSWKWHENDIEMTWKFLHTWNSFHINTSDGSRISPRITAIFISNMKVIFYY